MFVHNVPIIYMHSQTQLISLGAAITSKASFIRNSRNNGGGSVKPTSKLMTVYSCLMEKVTL